MANANKKTSNFITKELFGMAFALFCALGFLCLATGSLIFGSIGETVRKFFMGSMGFLSFPLLMLFGFFGIKAVIGFKVENEIAKRVFVYGSLYLLFISLLLQTAITPIGELGLKAYIQHCYTLGQGFKTTAVGGVLLGFFVWLICSGITNVGAFVLYGIALCLITVVLMRVRIVDGVSEMRERKAHAKKKIKQKRAKAEKRGEEDDGNGQEKIDFAEGEGKTRSLNLADDTFELKTAKDRRREKDKEYSLNVLFGSNKGLGIKKPYDDTEDYRLDLKSGRSYQSEYDADIERKTEYIRRPVEPKGITVNSPMGDYEQRDEYESSDFGRALDIDLSEVERDTYVINSGGRSRDSIPAFDERRDREGGFESGGERYSQGDFLGDNSYNGERDSSFNGDRSFDTQSQQTFVGDSGLDRQDRLSDSGYRGGGRAFGNIGGRATFEPDADARSGEYKAFEDMGGRGYSYSGERVLSEEDRRRENYRKLSEAPTPVEDQSQPAEQMLFRGDEINGRSSDVLHKLSRAGRSGYTSRPTGGEQNTAEERNSYASTASTDRMERVYVPKNDDAEPKKAQKQPVVNQAAGGASMQTDMFGGSQAEGAGETTKKPAGKRLSSSDLPEDRRLINPIDNIPRSYRYHFPPLNLLEDYLPDDDAVKRNRIEQEKRKETILAILNQANINATIEEVRSGPTITRFEISIPPTVPIKKVIEKQEDLNLWLAARDKIRIVAPIPGTTRIGIEVPNASSSKVGLKSIIASRQFKDASMSSLTFCLGKDTIGNIVLSDISVMPHLLVAGATGTGKSVFLNTLLISLMYKYSPEDLRIIIVDPKIVEFSIFKGIPNLMFDEVITEQRKALAMLEWAVKEMNERYQKLNESLVKDIKEYNAYMTEKKGKKMPRILIIVDEFADLMASSSDKKLMENKISRLAAKARAAGIHLIMATQRPSADIMEGSIKTNFVSRIAFKMASATDAQVIMGEVGAEKLLGMGDVLHRTGKMSTTERAQGAFIDTPEIERVCRYLRENNQCYYNEFALEEINKNSVEEEAAPAPDTATAGGDGVAPRNDNEIIKQAMRIAILTNNVSGSMLQRKLGLGYPKAAKIMDLLMSKGYVGAPIDNRHREIFMDREQFKQTFGEDVDAPSAG